MSAKPYNIRKLPKNSFSLQKETPKYYLNYCQDKINNQNPTTNGWINVIKTLKMPLQDFDKSIILLAKLEKHKDIVVKLGDDDSIRKEYEYSKKLYKLKGFVKFICYFECNDNFLDYPNEKRTDLCNGEGSQMKIIVMPHFEMGCIGFYSWTNENVNVLRSCIKHALLTYISAFVTGYLHGDFHPGNVLLKKTKQNSIDYLFDGIGEVSNVETNGVRTWIMDFENTREVQTPTTSSPEFSRSPTMLLRNISGSLQKENKRDIIDFYSDIHKFFMLLHDYRFVKNIDKSTTVHLMQIVTTHMNNLIYPNMVFINNIIISVDKIQIII